MREDAHRVDALLDIGGDDVLAAGVQELPGPLKLAVGALAGLTGGMSLFAGGAMIWVVSSEIIPETHRDRQEGIATGSLMVGLAVMMSLDWIFG